MGQESRSGLAGWFWLRVSHEVELGLSSRTVVFSRLDRNWKVQFQDGTLIGFYQEVPIPHPVGLSKGHMSVQRHLASLSESNPGEREKSELGYLFIT